MAPVDDRVRAELELLRNMQFANMSPEDYLGWQEKVDDINDQYNIAKAKGDSDKYAKALGESIAKALPAIVKSTQAAIVAFEKGDAISGTAAIMDICAAAAPVIAAMLDATGPEGMLVGALFSVIGQILSFFGPKQPSLMDQIADLMKELNTEEQLKDLDAIHLANKERDASLTSIYLELAEHTQLSLLVRDADKAEFEDLAHLAGKRIIVARGSAAAVNAKIRYPNCTMQFIDEVARGVRSGRDQILANLIAGKQADAVYDLDITNQSRSKKVGGLAMADVHQSPSKPEPSILELPLLTENDADEYQKRLIALNIGVRRSSAKADFAEFKTWEVAAWLRLTEKQVYPRWPEVLGVWCQTFSEIVDSNTKFNCLIDPDIVQQKVRYLHQDNKDCPLDLATRKTIHDLLVEVQGLAQDLRRETEACYTVALEVLQSVTPVAQDWGLFAHIGTNQSIYFMKGRSKFDSWKDKSDSYYCQFMALVPAPASNQGGSGPSPQYDFKPRHHLLLQKESAIGHGWLEHRKVHYDTFDLDDGDIIRDRPQFQDICAAQNGDHLDCWAVPGGRDGVESWTMDKDYKFTQKDNGWHKIDKASVENVSAVYLTLDCMVEGDPDCDAIEPGSDWFMPGSANYTALVYAGLRASSDFYVLGVNGGHYVASPYPAYTAVVADSHYLWIFTPGGFACATHASIIKCIQDGGQASTVRWMFHALPSNMMGRFLTDVNHNPIPPDQMPMDGNGKGNYWEIDGVPRVRPMPALRGMESMSPCDDQTIFASVIYREASSEPRGYADPTPVCWIAQDIRKMYVTSYTIDVARQALVVREPWTPIGGQALKVQKLTVPCWSLFSSLKLRLQTA